MLTRLERDLQSISWTSSFFIGGLFGVLYDMLLCMILYSIIVSNHIEGKYTKREVDIQVIINVFVVSPSRE